MARPAPPLVTGGVWDASVFVICHLCLWGKQESEPQRDRRPRRRVSRGLGLWTPPPAGQPRPSGRPRALRPVPAEPTCLPRTLAASAPARGTEGSLPPRAPLTRWCSHAARLP